MEVTRHVGKERGQKKVNIEYTLCSVAPAEGACEYINVRGSAL